MVVAAAALFLCSPANAQESPEVAVTGEAASAAAPQSSAATPDGNWHFAITPYIWFAGAHGTAGFLGPDASFHPSFADIFTYLNIGLMAAREARKDRFLIPLHFICLNLSTATGLPHLHFPDPTPP